MTGRGARRLQLNKILFLATLWRPHCQVPSFLRTDNLPSSIERRLARSPLKSGTSADKYSKQVPRHLLIVAFAADQDLDFLTTIINH